MRKKEKRKRNKKKNEEYTTDNNIGDEGTKAMSEMLKVNTSLTTLDLGSVSEKKKRKKRKERANDRQ